MKRNWPLIAVVIAFIVLYQVFVLNPQMEAQRKAVQQHVDQKNAEATALTTTQAGTPSADSATAASTAGTSTDSKAPLRPVMSSEGIKLGLGPQRSVQAGDFGTLKTAILEDYRPQAAPKGVQKSIMNGGITLHSTNATIETCLSSMVMSSAEGAVQYSGKAGAATCTVSYTADSQHRSLLNASVTLSGFTDQTGEIFLRFNDEVGSGDVQDQNFISYSFDTSKTSLRAKDLFVDKRASGAMDYVAWGDRYFSTIFIPKGKYMPTFYVQGQVLPEKDLPQTASFGVSYPLNPEKLNGAYTYDYSIYFGTRDPGVLEEIDPKLAKSVDLGIFAPIARAMLWLLKLLNKLFNNFGVSIIALTLLVRFAFWPLNRKAYSSSLAMKQIQPEVNRIREKYGKDSSKAAAMNAELLQLYKKNKVNPLGGCLPILLQIPIFIGLYGALNHSIDLYGAPFFWWIQDLSFYDPYYVFPILWTLSLIGSMQLNPQATGGQPGMPDMKWMFLGMNIFFGYLSKNWPAGLTIYLFVSNLVGVFQQVMMRRESKKLEMIQEGA